MYEDRPSNVAYTLFNQTMWGRTAAGRSIIGSAKNIQNITRDEIVQYYKTHYCAENIIISIAGNFSKDKAEDLVRDKFSNLPTSARPKIKYPVKPRSNKTIKNKKIEQVHLYLGYPTIKRVDPESYRESVTAEILGGGMSTRLFQEIREKLGYAYSVYAFNNSMRQLGCFGIYVGTSKKYIAQVIDSVHGELVKLRSSLVSPEELEQGKQSIRGAWLLEFDNTYTRAMYLAKKEFYEKKVEPIACMLQAIDQVTMEQVRDFSNKWFLSATEVISMAGPISKKIFN